MDRKYGWRKQLPDQRDIVYRPKVTHLPAAVRLGNLPPVKDQGNLGSCTANGLTSVVEFLELKDKHPYTPLSRLFLYYNERVIENTVRSDAGADIRDGVKAFNKIGCCPESVWPYVIKKFAIKPTAPCYNGAVAHGLIKYAAINGLAGMKSCLAAGFPFVFGFTVYDSFESDAVASTGVVPMPSPSESCLGGHCVYCVGYDDKLQRFICVNSWGTGWGNQGLFSLPYAYMSNQNLASDFWVLAKTRSE
jgi:C1A family cysteine protease